MRILDWNCLSTAQRREALQRPAAEDTARITAVARDIIERVRREGDAGLLALTEQFDGVRLEALQVTPQEFALAPQRVAKTKTAGINPAARLFSS